MFTLDRIQTRIWDLSNIFIKENKFQENKSQENNFIKKETLAQMFFCEFWEIHKNTFLQNTFHNLCGTTRLLS